MTVRRHIKCDMRVVDFLWRQAQLNSRISVVDFDALISAKLDEPVFSTRLGSVAKVPNLNHAFSALLDDLGLKTGATCNLTSV